MNFLAHIYLSGNNDQLKIGNFIADAVKGNSYKKYPTEVQKGIILHRAIDFYTDTHPIARKSSARLFERYGHFNGIIVDILYDHFLALHWRRYSEKELDVYVDEFYELLQENFEILPKRIQQFMPYMVEDNWLLSYATIEGIGKILYQMNLRTKDVSKMNFAVEELELFYTEFESEFLLFFEELQTFVSEKMTTL
ncbi:MAG TPA: acyl carrier protein phosphodiesterase [Salinimicrobium sp.]|nr:acyl carrier protein phosphodiesterase [Salinimicrobium sp.]